MFTNRSNKYSLKSLLVFSLLFFLPFQLLFPQNFDSLLNEISALSEREQIKLLNQECWNYRSKNPDYALEVGKYALELGEKIGDKSLQATSSNFLGIVYRNIGNFGLSMAHYQKALSLAIVADDSVQIAYSYNNIGGIYRMQLQFKLALDNIFRALKIFERLGKEEGMSYCYINIGIIFREMHDYDKAIEYLTKTIQIRDKIGDKFGRTLALNHLAEVYRMMGERKKTYETYLKLLNDYSEMGDTKGEAVIYGSMADYLFKNGEYEESILLSKLALSLNKEIRNLEDIIIDLLRLAKISIKLKMMDEAKKYLDEVKTLADSTDFIIGRLNYLEVLSEYYIARNDYKRAFYVFKKHDELQDSIKEAENKMRINAVESMYSVERLLKEKSLLEKNLELKKNQQTYLLILSVFVVFVLIMFVIKERKTRKLNALLTENNVTKDKFFNIIAHDLKNPFNSMLGYSELLINDYDSFTESERIEAIKEMNNSTKKLFNLVNNLLEWARSQSNKLHINKVEVEITTEIQNIIEVFKPLIKQKNINIKFDTKNKFKLNVDENVFHTVIRNLLSNAIKFTHENGSVEIIVEKKGKYLEVHIIDTGTGMSEEKVKSLFDLKKISSCRGTAGEEGTGLGLILVKELIERCNGKIKVESEINKGSKFTVCFPL